MLETNHSLHLKSYIQVFDVEVPESFLENLCANASFTQALTGNEGKVNMNVRNCFSSEINKQSNEHKIIWNNIDKLIKKYNDGIEFKVEISENHDGYNLLKYQENGFYKEHFDMALKPRTLSIIILLNDSFEGGELSFFRGTYTPSFRRNQAILFPSNFLYPHQVTTVTKGERYSIATWVI